MLSSTFCDELGFVPLSKTGAELLFEVFSRRYERSATLVTSNLLCGEPHKRFNAGSSFMRRAARRGWKPGLFSRM
jgi:DNA replication protein DnaC